MDPAQAQPTLETVLVEGLRGRCGGTFARPNGPAWKSGVVVLGEPADRYLTTVCTKLASAGHAAIALQLDLAPLTEQLFLTPSAFSYLAECTAAVTAALELVRAKAATPPPRWGAVGFGAGGLVSLTAGYRYQIGASVSFYAEGPVRLRANLRQIFDRPKPHAAPTLCLVGAFEEVLPADLAAIGTQFRHFGMRETMVIYPRRKTGFCHPSSPTYREEDARDAWGRLLRALECAPRQRYRFVSKAHS